MIPNPSRVTIASVRSEVVGQAERVDHVDERDGRERERDATSPVTTPSGRRRPPVTPAPSTAGSTGSTQGESAVAAPATQREQHQENH